MARALPSERHMEADLERADDLRNRIIGAAITVHTAIGPGLLESVYLRCLLLEFKAVGLAYQTQLKVPLTYRGVAVDSEFRLDALVEGLVIVEVKAVERLHPVFTAQLITYLKLMDVPMGLLINFNVRLVKDGARRIEHPSIYKSARAASGRKHEEPL